jgi:SagB-type dehydrogenase family enzyme
VTLRSATAVPLVYGADEPPLDDPAEAYHEASSLYPSFGLRQTRGYLLAASEELRVSSGRAARLHPQRPRVSLPTAALPRTPFAQLVASRRSSRTFAQAPLRLAELAAVLHAGYGVTGRLDQGAPVPLRAVPSGGALYPLDVWVSARAVAGLAAGLYHFDPLAAALEVVYEGDATTRLAATSVYPEPTAAAAAVLVVSASLWRTRFKYRLRGYRFALLEAGHLAQNVLLAATGLGLGALPIGGFFDRPLAQLLDLDGVNEVALYLLALGRRT